MLKSPIENFTQLDFFQMYQLNIENMQKNKIDIK